MNLPVLPTDPAWYSGGLKFTCTQCGNCCTGGPGFVWISKDEIVRLANFLGITPEETVEQYCRKVDGRFSLRERRNKAGTFDCVFLTQQPAVPSDGQTVTHTRAGCGVYPVRPLQCRTWPFWPENLGSREAWDQSAKKCHGMNRGRRFSETQVNAVRDAEDWPDKPPTSKKAK